MSHPIPAAVENKSNILGILGFVFAFLLPLAGLILSIVALVKAKNYGETSKALAIAGVVVASILLIIQIIIIILLTPAFIQGFNEGLNQDLHNHSGFQQNF